MVLLHEKVCAFSFRAPQISFMFLDSVLPCLSPSCSLPAWMGGFFSGYLSSVSPPCTFI